MQEVIILVEDSEAGKRLQEQITALIQNSEVGREAIVLPGYIKKPT